MAKMHDCQNIMKEGKCDEWIMSHFRTGENADIESHELEERLKRADEICAECKHFLKKKAAPEQHSGTHQLLKKGKIVID
jgi:hypothetical protein